MNLGKLISPEDIDVIYEPTELTASYRDSNNLGRGYINKAEMNNEILNPKLADWSYFPDRQEHAKKVLQVH
jgi:hypothetical protein